MLVRLPKIPESKPSLDPRLANKFRLQEPACALEQPAPNTTCSINSFELYFPAVAYQELANDSEASLARCYFPWTFAMISSLTERGASS
jgi:hypothetical protein